MKKSKHDKLVKDYDKQKERHLERLATKMLKNADKNEKLKEPIEPDIVLFGLIFDNFFPLNSFPNIKPPISEAIATRTGYIKKIFNSGLIAKI